MSYGTDRRPELRLVNQRTYREPELADLVGRWHAPRLNRWEQLVVRGGGAVLEFLRLEDSMPRIAVEDHENWVRPGERWRLGHLESGARLEVGIHADDRSSSSRPVQGRDIWLKDLPWLHIDCVATLNEWLESLSPNEKYICTGRFEWEEVVKKILNDKNTALSWHLLYGMEASYFCAVVVKHRKNYDLIDYLSRDHMIMEAAFTIACYKAEKIYWEYFKFLLLRHIRIEEEVLFPLFTNVTNRERIIEGLLREHGLIKNVLEDSGILKMRRKLWRLLEAHDEKEELLVYPELSNLIGLEDSAMIDRIIIQNHDIRS